MSVAEMKPSQVLREALKLMEDGKKWANHFASSLDERCCSIQAVDRAVGNFPDLRILQYLRRAIGSERIGQWNDHASDFSVIEQGFQKAILLAESEGK